MNATASNAPMSGPSPCYGQSSNYSPNSNPCGNRVALPSDVDSMSVLSSNCEEYLRTAPLGKNIRHCFNLEAGKAFLNHGSFGTACTPVLAAQAQYVTRMEMNPDRFFKKELPRLLRRSAGELAEFIHADADDVVLVTNTTTGVNSVLHSLDLQEEDEVLCLNLTYAAVSNTLRHICYFTQEYVQLKEVNVVLPLESYESLIEQVVQAITPKTRLAVLDHITSSTGLVLPLDRLICECHKRGVPVLVDGAHAPGQLPLNLRELNADFYVGNLYKWLFTSKSCAFLYVKKEFQNTVLPVVTSLGYEQGFVQDFSLQGTRDESSFLTVPTALAFYRALGFARVFAHNNGLINWACDYLAQLWGTEVLLPSWQRCPFMSCVRLPVNYPLKCDSTPRCNAWKQNVCNKIADVLYDHFGVSVLVAPIQDKIYVRISAQIYNEREDYERLGAAVMQLTSNSQCLVKAFEKLGV